MTPLPPFSPDLAALPGPLASGSAAPPGPAGLDFAGLLDAATAQPAGPGTGGAASMPVPTPPTPAPSSVTVLSPPTLATGTAANVPAPVSAMIPPGLPAIGAAVPASAPPDQAGSGAALPPESLQHAPAWSPGLAGPVARADTAGGRNLPEQGAELPEALPPLSPLAAVLPAAEPDVPPRPDGQLPVTVLPEGTSDRLAADASPAVRAGALAAADAGAEAPLREAVPTGSGPEPNSDPREAPAAATPDASAAAVPLPPAQAHPHPLDLAAPMPQPPVSAAPDAPAAVPQGAPMASSPVAPSALSPVAARAGSPQAAAGPAAVPLPGATPITGPDAVEAPGADRAAAGRQPQRAFRPEPGGTRAAGRPRLAPGSVPDRAAVALPAAPLTAQPVAAALPAEAAAGAGPAPGLSAPMPAPPPFALAAPAAPQAPDAARVAAQPPAPAAPQLESAIAQVDSLREALRTVRPAMTLAHAEFGQVSLRLEAAGSDGWRAVVASRDPGFVPAIQAALAERAVAAAAASPDSGGFLGQGGAGQNGTGDHRYGASPNAGQGSSQPYLGQSGGRDGEAAPDQRRPSTAAALGLRGEGEEEGSGGRAASSGGLFA